MIECLISDINMNLLIAYLACDYIFMTNVENGFREVLKNQVVFPSLFLNL